VIEVLGIATGAVLAAAGVRLAAPSRAPLRRPAPPAARVAQLERAERAAELISSASDVHTHLRPALRRIALERLLARGVELDGQPAASRRLLGEELWELVRERRPPPDRFAAGLTAHRRDAMLDRLEAL
jgi:hypothetical protein